MQSMTIEIPLAPGAGVSDGDGVPAVQVHEEPLPRRRRFLDLLDPDHPEEVWGCEDPRLTWLPEREEWAIAYTAYSDRGPLVSLAALTTNST